MVPRASVLMPAYEAEKTVHESVESVLAQTIGDLELIVADNASSTPVHEVLADVGDPRLCVVRRSRNGEPGAARNSALKLARAPFVSQLDADDLWEPDYLERILPCFDDPAVGLAYCDATILGHPGGRETYIVDPSIHPRDSCADLLEVNPIPSPTVTMRADALRGVGGWTGWLKHSEDGHLYLKLPAAGWRFAYVDRRLARYRWAESERGRSFDVHRMERWRVLAFAHLGLRRPRVPGSQAQGAALASQRRDRAGRSRPGDLGSGPVKAVILAGGVGSRLSEETSARPKPMVDIGGKPILWHIMKIYSAHGVHDFVICLGYKGYLIKEYFANYFLHISDVTLDIAGNSMEVHQSAAEPWRVTLIDTGEQTQTGGRLKRALRFVEDDDAFCFTYGDGVADIDVGASIEFHRRAGVLATITAVQPAGRFGALEVAGDRIMGFQEKPAGDGAWINGGFFVLSPGVGEYIEGDDSVWEREPLERLAAEGQLAPYRHDGFWRAMDTMRDRNDLEDLWRNGGAPWKQWS